MVPLILGNPHLTRPVNTAEAAPDPHQHCQGSAFQLEETQRVHVPNNWELRFWVRVIMVQVLGKSMIIGYLDP